MLNCFVLVSPSGRFWNGTFWDQPKYAKRFTAKGAIAECKLNSVACRAIHEDTISSARHRIHDWFFESFLYVLRDAEKDDRRAAEQAALMEELKKADRTSAAYKRAWREAGGKG